MKWILTMAVWTLGFTLSFAQSVADEKKTTKEKIEEKAEKLKAKKAKADSLLKGLPVGISGGAGLNAGATIGGKSIKPADAIGFFTEKLPDLGLKIKEVRKREKERRRKKKLLHTEYEGLAIAKMVTTIGSGDRLTQIEFHILKTYQQPSLYAPDVYWYDTQNRIVTKAIIKDKENALILHGPYKRYVSGNLIEEGNYYAGTKDGRWELYDAEFKLLDKSKWFRGFPAESVIAYYDSSHTKIREVTPVQFGKRQGDYFMFYEAGQMMAKGQYENDLPVKAWTEYYQYRRQRKKITQYPGRWYEDGEAAITSEWDDKGKLIFERPKDKETKEEEN